MVASATFFTGIQTQITHHLLAPLKAIGPFVDRAVRKEAESRPEAVQLMKQPGVEPVTALVFERSGMFWTVRGANAVIAMGCCRHSGEFDDYGESRLA